MTTPIIRTNVKLGAQTAIARTNYAQQFDDWVNAIKNTSVPAITDEDLQEAANYAGVERIWIDVVSEVESSGSSFESNGLTKILLEERMLANEVKRQLPTLASDIFAGGLLDAVGKKRGGLAEWDRAKQAVTIIAKYTQDFDTALNIVFYSASIGKYQVLGKWHNTILGYESPKAMVEAFHQQENKHLEAFIYYIQYNQLDVHLRAASTAKDPYPYVLKFAKGYNGKNCCGVGVKRNYAAEMMSTWRWLSDKKPEQKPLVQSRTMQGELMGLLAKGGSFYALLKAAGINVEDGISVDEVNQTISKLKNGIDTAASTTAALKESTVNLTNQVSQLQADNQQLHWFLWIIAIFLIISLFGHAKAIYARWDDHRRGYK